MTTTPTTAHDSRHTPGPFDFVPAESGGFRIYSKDNGANVAFTDDLNDRDIKGQQEDEANARLIAAAPELLEALKEAVSFIGLKHGWNDQSYQTTDGRVIWFCADKARQAIAKAEGRT